MDITTRRLVGTLIAVIGGTVAVILDAGVATALLITLLLEVIALQLASDEHHHSQGERLIEAVGLGRAISDNVTERELLRTLVSELSAVDDKGHPLFVRQAHDRLVAFVDDLRRLSGGVMTITDAREIQMEGIWLLEHLAERLFATSVVSMDTFWTESRGPDYHHKNLEVLSRGRKITRVFILDSSDALKNPRIRALLQEQLEAGVDVWYVSATKLPRDAVSDFGIWDDQMVCTLQPSATAPGEVFDATYDTTPAGLQSARTLQQLILHAAEQLALLPTPLASSYAEDGDYLRDSAPQMREIATEQCVGGYLDPTSCRWYHEAWQYLRLLHLVETPRLHASFFGDYVERLVDSSDFTNVLICGLADYEMVAVVLDALSEQPGSRYRLTVLDVCDTPLRITEWYATQRGAKVVTRRADARDCGLPAAAYDLIVTDAFLTKLPADERGDVVSEWRRILNDSGQVITTIKIDVAAVADGVRADTRQVSEYAGRAKRAAETLNGAAEIAPDDLEQLAKHYAEHNVSYPVEGDTAVQALFRGFDVSVLAVVPVTEYAISYYGQVVGVKTSDET